MNYQDKINKELNNLYNMYKRGTIHKEYFKQEALKLYEDLHRHKKGLSLLMKELYHD